MFSFLSGTRTCTEKLVMFETKVLRKMYALPDRKVEVFSAQEEISQRKLENTFTIQGESSLQNETSDTEIGNQEQIAVKCVKENAVAENVNLERWQGIGYVMPKKKRGWRNMMAKLFCSCYKAKNDAD